MSPRAKYMSINKLSTLLIGGVILTVLIYAGVMITLTWPISELSINKSAAFGDSFGPLTSLFSGLAFSGLIITIVMQKDELKLQRKELELQRTALQNQADELKNMSKYAALDQVRSMVNATILRLSESGGETTKPEHFFSAMMPGAEWKILLESTDPEEIMQAYATHSKKTAPADQFISSLASIAKFYLRSVGNESVDYTLDDNNFIYINSPWFKDVPYLSTHITSSALYAEQRSRYEPAHKMFMLAFLVASQKMTGNADIIKGGSIEELVEYLNERGKDLPAIART
jgi:hypothetical protein